MRIARKVQIVGSLVLGILLLFSGCASVSTPRLSADAQAEALSHFSLGLLAGAGGDSAAALEHFEAAIRLDPTEEKLYAPAIGTALELNQTNAAVRLGRELVKRHPDTVDPSLLLARIYALTGNPAQAEILFKKIRTQFPENPDAPLFLARLYLAQNRFADALETLRTAATAQDDNADLLHLLGTLCIDRSRASKNAPQAKAAVEEGIGFLKQALHLAPENPLRWQQLGFALLAAEQPEDALDAFQEARDYAPHDLTLARQTFSLLLKTGHFDEALADYDQLASDTGTEIELWLQWLIEELPKTERSRLAAELETQIREQPQTPTFYYVQLGLLYAAEKKYSKAEPLVLKAIERNPPSLEALYALMLLRVETKEYAKALESAQQIETLAQGDGKTNLLSGPFYYQYAALYERAGQLEKAERLFFKTIELGEGALAASARNYIAYMWAERGKKLDQGLELIQHALLTDPDNGAFLDTLGWIYYRQGNYAKALTELQKASALVPDDSTVWEHLGDAYLKLGNRTAAKEHWEKALQLDPTSQPLIEKLKNQPSY